jgi:hypothetical protein
VLRITRIVGLVAISCALFAASAQAGEMRGIVHSHGQDNGAANGGAGTNSNLQYHGGAVMHTNTVYAIFWIPKGYTVQAGYQSVIESYFQNVAHDSASGSGPFSTNVYWSDTQYTDTTGNAAYNSTFGGEIDDSHGFPRSGCRDRYTSVCLTDAQIEQEIKTDIGTPPTGLGTEYFVFTPRNVGSCDGSACSYSYFCAYHSNFAWNGNQVVYANMPYAAYVSRACGSGQSPNGNDADSTINVTSHEHNETITDPLGTAWWDSSGNEDGDKCAWNFGSALGGSFGAQYNEVINGAHYYLQQEWSNQSAGCVLQGL